MPNDITHKDRTTDLGAVRINNDAIATIASVAAMEIKGVSRMGGGLGKTLYEIVFRQASSKGVRITMRENEVKLTVSIIVDYGVDIPRIADEVQDNVKRSVEKMAGLVLAEVDVVVEGVYAPSLSERKIYKAKEGPMRIISGLTLFFYTLVFLAVGGLLIAVSLNLLPQEAVITALDSIYTTPNIRLVMGVTGSLLVFISIMVVQLTVGKLQRERTIAFENPDGQVTISLTAIEDFIKRAVKQIPEVKEMKPHVRAGKKGISIVNRVVLFSDISIPETTEKIQSTVKTRVLEMLGVEEPIAIKVHVVKIVHKDEGQKVAKKDDKGQSYKGSIEYGKF